MVINYLGGYRNTQTGLIFHNAETQTLTGVGQLQLYQEYVTRDTQTYYCKQGGTLSRRDAATQMSNKYLLLDNSRDKTLVAGSYFASNQLQKLKQEKALVIQRYYRGWVAKQRALQLRRQRLARERFLEEQERNNIEEEQLHREREIGRRMHPKRKEDFQLLCNELEQWRIQETNKIKASGQNTEEQQKDLQRLLYKEIKLLQTIDRLKINANKENQDEKTISKLKQLSLPKQWKISNGKKVLVHTPYTTRARELFQLYKGLTMPLLSIEERLDILLHVKWTVKEFDCNLTREIVQLINREADMLNRGRKQDTLQGLRNRLAALFLVFCDTPQFNPEVRQFEEQSEHYEYGTVDKSVVIHAPSQLMFS